MVVSWCGAETVYRLGIFLDFWELSGCVWICLDFLQIFSPPQDIYQDLNSAILDLAILVKFQQLLKI